MVRLVLTIDIAGWEIKVITEPMSDAVADLLLIELARNPTLEVKKSRKTRDL